jgi:hypothetical protein
MTTLQVHARTPLEMVTVPLSEIIALPDPEAAEALNARMIGLAQVDRLHALAPAERIIICRTFEERSLWRHLTDPETDMAFPNITAWLSSGFLGCRRVAMEAHKLGQKLADVQPMKLLGVTKDNLHTLVGLSTAVRNDPGVITAAKTLDNIEFEKKIAEDHPDQHLDPRGRLLRFRPGRKGAQIIEEAIEYALEHDIAGTRDEALVRAFETAMNEWKLEDELAHMPAEERDDSIEAN